MSLQIRCAATQTCCCCLQPVCDTSRAVCRTAVVTTSCGCRNRQVTAFYNVVDFFKPGFVLMENVVDIFKKEDGTYAKSAMASLLAMRYQVRAGIIAASGYGVPQIRNRSALLSLQQTLSALLQRMLHCQHCCSAHHAFSTAAQQHTRSTLAHNPLSTLVQRILNCPH